VAQKHPVSLHPIRRHESQKQTHEHRYASPIPKEQAPPESPGKRAFNFDANANPHNTPENQDLRWRSTNTASTGTTRQTPPMRRRRSEDVERPSATRRSSRRRHQTTPQQPCREKRETSTARRSIARDRCSGLMVKAGGPPSRPASRCTTSLNSRRNARGEQKREKNKRLYSAEMQPRAA
jgi:hypothetical protein